MQFFNSNNKVITPKYKINDKVFYNGDAVLDTNREIKFHIKLPCIIVSIEIVSVCVYKQAARYKLGLLTPTSKDFMVTFGVIKENLLEEMTNEQFENLFKNE